MTIIANTKLINIQNEPETFNPLHDIDTSRYYIFTAKNLPVPISPESLEGDIKETQYTIFEEMNFGKKVSSTDMKYGIRRNVWTSNTVYAIYDDSDNTLHDKDFFVCADEAGSYHIFKCLYNNGDVPSTSKPLLSETAADDHNYVTSDGYRWKYMYTINNTDWTKYNTPYYIPIIANNAVSGNATAGSISTILISTGGNNYSSFVSGYFEQISVGGNTTLHAISTGSSNTNFYTGCAIYISAGTGSGQVKRIVSYGPSGNTLLVGIESVFTTQPDLTSQYQIAPDVRITGDGANAIAVAVVNTSINSILRVDMVNQGSGYTYANVVIVGNTGTIEANSATARAIISPRNGHGYNPISELGGSQLIISTTFANNEAGLISSNNEFSRIGIIKNPLIANVELVLSSTSGSYTVGESVSQATVTGVVISSNATYMNLTTVNGYFTANSTKIIGAAGNSTISTVTTQIGNVFSQTTRLGITALSGSFALDDYAVQGNASSGQAFGYIQDKRLVSGSDYYLYMSAVKGTFSANASVYLTSSDGVSKIAQITSVVPGNLSKYTGKLIYAENLVPVTRSNTQTETVKIVLKYS
jgi:hypothetical protein